MPADEPDLYAILGVAADASPAHIAHAYRRLIRAGHPDHHPHADTAALTTVAAAYAILRDPARRAAYDQTRRPHHNQQPPPPHLHRNARAPYPTSAPAQSAGTPNKPLNNPAPPDHHNDSAPGGDDPTPNKITRGAGAKVIEHTGVPPCRRA